MAKTEIQASVGLDTTKFQRGLARSQKSIKNFAQSGISSMIRLGGVFAGIGLVKSMISLASSAEETADKFNSVFGPAADEMNAKVAKLKETIPATTKELQDATAVFGLMAQSFGLNSKASEDFSINMVKIAGDLASFHDIAPDVAFDKLRAGIAGSSEPLQALGIDIREAALKQEALNLGIWDGVGVLSTSQKAMAVQSAVISQMGAASGNAALTINSTANQMKFLVRGLKEAGTTIGTAILPVIQDFAEGIRIIGAGIEKLKTKDVVKEVANDFEKMARANLANRGLLESNVKLVKDFSTFGSKAVKDTDAIARNEALIAERAAELEASYNSLDESQKSVLDSTGDIADESSNILEANQALEDSLKAQVVAQGKFAAQQKISKGTTKAGKAGKAGTAMGYNIERGEFEARGDFTDRRNKAIQALNELRDKLAQQDVTGRSAGITDQLVLAAQGGGTSANPAVATEEAAKSSAESLKAIETELTRTS